MRRTYHLIPILISLAVIVLSAIAFYYQPAFIHEFAVKMEQQTYDEEIRSYHKPLNSNQPISIVDIDNKSLAKEGRWPWDRKKLAALVRRLHELGAKVVAFDMVFSEPSINPVDQILQSQSDSNLNGQLEAIRPQFDSDTIFSQSLKEGQNVLGIAFVNDPVQQGMLSEPIFNLSQSDAQICTILEGKGYLGNQPEMAQTCPQNGFINTTIDSDGVIRETPLIYRHGTKVYASLALFATHLFLDQAITDLKTVRLDDKIIVRSISMGNTKIPLDSWGRILVPFRGPSFTFPYLSATDVLNSSVPAEKVRGKLIFIGTSATALGDNVSTAISSVFPGVEVQASVASGILDGYLPHKPLWGRHASLFFIIIVGLIFTFAIPKLTHFQSFLLFVGLFAVLYLLNRLIWYLYGLSLSFFMPIPGVITIFIVDVIASIAIKKHHHSDGEKS